MKEKEVGEPAKELTRKICLFGMDGESDVSFFSCLDSYQLGNPIDSFDGRAVNAEGIWEALKKTRQKGATLHYPATSSSHFGKDFTAVLILTDQKEHFGAQEGLFQRTHGSK